MTAVLTLERTNRATGAALAVADGYIPDQAGVQCFNGGGTVSAIAITSAELGLMVDGGGFSLGMRWWLDAGDKNPGARGENAIALFGMPGIDSAGVGGGVGVRLEVGKPDVPLSRRFELRAKGSVVASGVDGAVPTGPCSLLMTFERRWGGCLITLYVDGVQVLSASVPVADVPLTSGLVFGDLFRSDGGFSHVALWTRVLGSDEAAIDLTQLPGVAGGGGGLGSCDPLLNTDGTTAIKPDFEVPRVDGANRTLVDEGLHRWTRNPHETRSRVYTLPFNLADPFDFECLRQALEVTRGGATWTRWRHPQDDAPGPVATAPRYRIVNAGDAGIALDRTRAGQAAKFTLVLESLDL